MRLTRRGKLTLVTLYITALGVGIYSTRHIPSDEDSTPNTPYCSDPAYTMTDTCTGGYNTTIITPMAVAPSPLG